eukprot:COSAG05_NODE_11131_length_529_cov_0.937209_1_plen_131_part_01
MADEIVDAMTEKASELAEAKQKAEEASTPASEHVEADPLSKSSAPFAAPSTKPKARRFSISRSTEEDTAIAPSLAAAGQIFNIKQGRKELQLQLTGMALQIYRNGQQIESYLYAQLQAWETDGDNSLVLKL